MSDSDRGVYGKFIIKRTDGRDAPGAKHDGCDYFVLDLTHDPFALPALRAYASACEATQPELAVDLLAKLGLTDDAEPREMATALRRMESRCEPDPWRSMREEPRVTKMQDRENDKARSDQEHIS